MIHLILDKRVTGSLQKKSDCLIMQVTKLLSDEHIPQELEAATIVGYFISNNVTMGAAEVASATKDDELILTSFTSHIPRESER